MIMIPLMQQENRRLDQNKDDDKNYHKQRRHGLLWKGKLVLPFDNGYFHPNWVQHT
jgi:hypothetical protein